MIRALIVPENRLMGGLLARALDEEPGLRVQIAETLGEGLAGLGLCDVVLVQTAPDASKGLESIRALARPGGIPRVIAVGVQSDQDSILACIEAGASGYVLADASIEELHRAVRAAHSGEAHLTPDVAAAVMTRLALRTDWAAPSAEDDAAGLTLREREVLDLIAAGQTNAQIAQGLGIQLGTVKNHVHNILRKLNVTSREAAVALGQAARGEPA